MIKSLPPIGDLNRSDADTFAAAMAMLFEPVPVLCKQLLLKRPFESYAGLIEAAETLLLPSRSLDNSQLLTLQDKREILGAHPRIGQVGNLSALSQEEQTRVACSEETLATLGISCANQCVAAQLNQAYEDRHGFKVPFSSNGSMNAVCRVCQWTHAR